MRKRAVVVLLGLAFLVAGVSAQAALIDFSTSPADGIVQGPAGSTLGWGYTITNNSSYDLLLYLIDTSVSANGVPDTFVFDYPYLAAGATATVDYAPGVSGLFEFTWNPGVADGTTETGFVNLTGDLLDVDFNLVETVVLTASYTAIVTPASTAVPEPGTLILLGSGLAALAGLRRKQAA